ANVHALVKNQPGLAFDDLGQVSVKNIAEPVHILRVRSGAAGMAQRWSFAPARKAMSLALIVVVGIIGLGAGLYVAFPDLLPALSGADRRTQFSHPAIAVLPFENLSGDAAQDYFAAGITEDVILALGRFSDLTVIAREAAQQYAGKALQPG